MINKGHQMPPTFKKYYKLLIFISSIERALIYRLANQPPVPFPPGPPPQ